MQWTNCANIWSSLKMERYWLSSLRWVKAWKLQWTKRLLKWDTTWKREKSPCRFKGNGTLKKTHKTRYGLWGKKKEEKSPRITRQTMLNFRKRVTRAACNRRFLSSHLSKLKVFLTFYCTFTLRLKYNRKLETDKMNKNSIEKSCLQIYVPFSYKFFALEVKFSRSGRLFLLKFLSEKLINQTRSDWMITIYSWREVRPE